MQWVVSGGPPGRQRLSDGSASTQTACGSPVHAAQGQPKGVAPRRARARTGASVQMARVAGPRNHQIRGPPSEGLFAFRGPTRHCDAVCDEVCVVTMLAAGASAGSSTIGHVTTHRRSTGPRPHCHRRQAASFFASRQAMHVPARDQHLGFYALRTRASLRVHHQRTPHASRQQDWPRADVAEMPRGVHQLERQGARRAASSVGHVFDEVLDPAREVGAKAIQDVGAGAVALRRHALRPPIRWTEDPIYVGKHRA